MEPGWDENVELHEGRYWSAGLCAGVGDSGGVGGGVGVDMDGADDVGSGGGVGGAVGDGCGNNGVEMLVEVGCVGVVSESSGGCFVVVVVLEDFEVVLWCGWRMALRCWNE